MAGNRRKYGGVSRAWVVLGVLYAAFFWWYTSFEGPLTDEEVAHFTVVLEGAMEDGERRQNWVRFMETDSGDDFAMWNALAIRETPELVPGVAPGDSSEEVMARYSAPFFQRSLWRASHPVLGGEAAAPALDVWGIDGAGEWDAGVLVRYRSRRDVMEILEAIAAADSNIHDFKLASLEKTIAFPLDPWASPGDPRLLLGLVLLALALVCQLRRTAQR